MIMQPDYRATIERMEYELSQQTARMELQTSYKRAREAIEMREMLGKDTSLMRKILRYAESNGMSFEGAEASLIHSNKLQSMVNERYSR